MKKGKYAIHIFFVCFLSLLLVVSLNVDDLGNKIWLLTDSIFKLRKSVFEEANLALASLALNMKNTFMNNVKSFFGGIVDGAKASLGIHSPSREMRDEVGKWIPAGVEVGIKREMPKLNETVQDEFNNLSNINVPIPRISNENTQSNNLSNARNTVIEVPLNLDGVEIARAIIEPFKLIEGDYERSHNVKFAY